MADFNQGGSLSSPPTTGVHWLDMVLLISVAIAVLAGGYTAIQSAMKHLRKWSRFFDAILGEPAEFGQPSRPGILERMDGFNDRLDHQDKLLKQLVPNGGGSLRDQTNRIEADLAKLGGRIEMVGRDLGDHMQQSAALLMSGEQVKAQMWEAINTIAKSKPPELEEGHDDHV